MNVSLTPELDQFVASRVEAGDYATASEVVRDALRILKAEHDAYQLKLEALRVEIQKGIDSPKSDGKEAMQRIRESIGLREDIK